MDANTFFDRRPHVLDARTAVRRALALQFVQGRRDVIEINAVVKFKVRAHCQGLFAKLAQSAIQLGPKKNSGLVASPRLWRLFYPLG
jgi:hypothetical protein